MRLGLRPVVSMEEAGVCPGERLGDTCLDFALVFGETLTSFVKKLEGMLVIGRGETDVSRPRSAQLKDI
jgi:hypothetical protein